LNRPTSLYLDLIRFLAATVVFLGHAGMRRWSGGLLWQFTLLGNESVVVFFVLSGFVIAYAAAERERSARIYSINRMARIYSVAIPALALTLVLDAIGLSVDPDLYLKWPDYIPGQMLWQILNSILFTNQVWFNHVQPGTIGPYWSMGYEVPYYIAFGVAAFAPRSWAVFGAALVLVVAGPNIAALFPMWLLGLVTYRFCAKSPVSKWVGAATWLLSIVFLTLMVMPLRERHALSDIELTYTGLRDLLYFYTIATLFAANIIGFRGASPLIASTIEFVAKPIRWAGQRTFALYLFHMPIIQFIVAVTPWPPASWLTRGLVFLGVPIIVFGLAQFTELRKDAWRKAFDALLIGNLPLLNLIGRLGRRGG
jgi:peptidoglycan/LPS O-acetylase OafA/YrhL